MIKTPSLKNSAHLSVQLLVVLSIGIFIAGCNKGAKVTTTQGLAGTDANGRVEETKEDKLRTDALEKDKLRNSVTLAKISADASRETSKDQFSQNDQNGKYGLEGIKVSSRAQVDSAQIAADGQTFPAIAGAAGPLLGGIASAHGQTKAAQIGADGQLAAIKAQTEGMTSQRVLELKAAEIRAAAQERKEDNRDYLSESKNALSLSIAGTQSQLDKNKIELQERAYALQWKAMSPRAQELQRPPDLYAKQWAETQKDPQQAAKQLQDQQILLDSKSNELESLKIQIATARNTSQLNGIGAQAGAITANTSKSVAPYGLKTPVTFTNTMTSVNEAEKEALLKEAGAAKLRLQTESALMQDALDKVANSKTPITADALKAKVDELNKQGADIQPDVVGAVVNKANAVGSSGALAEKVKIQTATQMKVAGIDRDINAVKAGGADEDRYMKNLKDEISDKNLTTDTPFAGMPMPGWTASVPSSAGSYNTGMAYNNGIQQPVGGQKDQAAPSIFNYDPIVITSPDSQKDLVAAPYDARLETYLSEMDKLAVERQEARKAFDTAQTREQRDAAEKKHASVDAHYKSLKQGLTNVFQSNAALASVAQQKFQAALDAANTGTPEDFTTNRSSVVSYLSEAKLSNTTAMTNFQDGLRSKSSYLAQSSGYQGSSSVSYGGSGSSVPAGSGSVCLFPKADGTCPG